ncbi:DUF4253 domain-containing protein [Soonwooa purpurea]
MKFSKLLIIMGFLNSLFGCGQTKLNNSEINLINSIGYEKQFAEEIKNEAKNTIVQIPKINEYGEVLNEKDNGLSTKIEDENKAFNFISSNKEKYKQKGYNLFLFEDDNSQKFLTIVKNKTDFQILEWRQTNGVNHDIDNQKIISKLTEWKNKHDFILLGCGMDWLQVKFTAKTPNFNEFSKEIYEFCPDVVDQGTGDLEKLTEEMQKINGIYLWWD